jgi:hypothetical protein
MMRMRVWRMMVVMVVVPFASGLDNGLALTPQMGWSSWLVKSS